MLRFWISFLYQSYACLWEIVSERVIKGFICKTTTDTLDSKQLSNAIVFKTVLLLTFGFELYYINKVTILLFNQCSIICSGVREWHGLWISNGCIVRFDAYRDRPVHTTIFIFVVLDLYLFIFLFKRRKNLYYIIIYILL